MARYLVERLIPRTGELTAQELKAIAQQILLFQQELEVSIRWMQSVLTADGWSVSILQMMNLP